MLSIKKFTFNPFGENTYVLYDETRECVIIDPGCYTKEEEAELEGFIRENELKPVKLVLTHAHIDHVLGNKFVAETFGLEIYAHRESPKMLAMMPAIGQMYGIPAKASPEIVHFLDEGMELEFGNTRLSVYFCPGHSPDSLVYYHAPNSSLIGGDVLFYGSIGRTDLPGGDFDTLIRSIREKLYKLPDNTVVYSGHGPETTIGDEKASNPFVN